MKINNYYAPYYFGVFIYSVGLIYEWTADTPWMEERVEWFINVTYKDLYGVDGMVKANYFLATKWFLEMAIPWGIIFIISDYRAHKYYSLVMIIYYLFGGFEYWYNHRQTPREVHNYILFGGLMISMVFYGKEKIINENEIHTIRDFKQYTFSVWRRFASKFKP